jgi:chromosome segregation ATPase
MGGGTIQLALIAIGACLLGILVGWVVQFVRSKRRIREVSSAAQGKLSEVIAQREVFASRYARSRAQQEQLEATSARQSAKLESVVEKARLLGDNVRLLRQERETTKRKLGALQTTLTALKQRTRDLQTEFDKTREFYKRELLKSLQKRKELEQDIVNARAEQDAFAKAVEASSLEHGSTENMVIAAQLRLGQLQVLAKNVNKLEAENDRLRDDIRQAKEDYAAREKELAELEQLRINNRQLVKCVEALEQSRKAHETDADRYRQKADESEKLSDTLRLKLDDLEKNFLEMEQQQDEAIEDVRKAAVVPILKNQQG